MQTGDIGDMMSQFKKEKNITGEGITDARALATEAQDTIEKAQQTPVEKPAEEPKQEEQSTAEQPAPEQSNVQLNSDVKMSRRDELLAIETSSETQRLLDEANEVLVENPKSKKAAVSTKPVVKDATKKVSATKKVEATKVAPKKIELAKKPAAVEEKPQAALVQKPAAQKASAKPAEGKSEEKSEHKHHHHHHHKHEHKEKEEEEEESDDEEEEEEPAQMIVQCPAQQQCPACDACPPESPLVELQEDGKQLRFQPDPDSPELIQLSVIPSNFRDTVKSVDVVDSSKILGFNTFNDMLTQEKHSDLEDRESDFYNVTVNLVLRRMTKFQADETHKKRMQAKTGEIVPLQHLSQILENRPEDQAQVLTFTDLITTLENEGGLVVSDTNEDNENDEAEIQEKSENMHAPKPRDHKFTEYIVPKDKKDQVDEVFSKIQDDDMRQEQSFDQTSVPKTAALQQEMAHEREHDQFLRRLDRNHMSSVTQGNKVEVEAVPEAETNTATDEESHQQVEQEEEGVAIQQHNVPTNQQMMEIKMRQQQMEIQRQEEMHQQQIHQQEMEVQQQRIAASQMAAMQKMKEQREQQIQEHQLEEQQQ